tara:strand:- start:383 stop:730 length:348 start_codon:yes stop_codon:yes gene_type:complete
MGMTFKQKFNKKYGFKLSEPHSIREISKITGYTYQGLKKIFEKGEGAYSSNPQSVRKNVTSAQQWAYARVYASVSNGSKANKIDKALLKPRKGFHIMKSGAIMKDSDMKTKKVSY